MKLKGDPHGGAVLLRAKRQFNFSVNDSIVSVPPYTLAWLQRFHYGCGPESTTPGEQGCPV